MGWLLNGMLPLKRRLTVIDADQKRPLKPVRVPIRARSAKCLLPRRRREKVATGA